MIKSAILASAICFAFIVPASAQATVKCDEKSLMEMRTGIDAMTDKEKQTTTIASWEAAMAAFKANNMDDCNARMSDTGKGMGDGSFGGGNNSNSNNGGDGQTQSN